MRVGFTGTRDGMTELQFESFRKWVRGNWPTAFHHGGCKGADERAALEVRRQQFFHGLQPCVIVVHLGDTPSQAGHDGIQASDTWVDRKPNLVRNKDIVESTDVLLACPKGPEELRSGTWSTVRLARKQGKRVVIFWPDGSVTEEGPK